MFFNKNDFSYNDRKSKQLDVAKKYREVLKGRILDVGADEGYLSNFLSDNTDYVGIGLGGKNPEIIKVDLEKEPIPFDDESFDCVLCLDVLEHLDNIHDVFNDICRVSRKYVLISLPNPWKSFLGSLRKKYKNNRNMKFYGLPKEKDLDRHKWFFSPLEANEFIEYNAAKSDFKVIDYYQDRSLFKKDRYSGKIKYLLLKLMMKIFFRADLSFDELFTSASWWLLKRGNVVK